MMSDEELLKMFDSSMKDYKGQLDHFYEAVGMVVVGRLMGWRVMRLVSSKRCWTMAIKLFGDPKELMREEEKYAYKSVGLKIVKKIGDYWGIIRGNKDRNELPLKERKMLE